MCLSKKDVIWLINTIPKHVVETIIADYNPYAMFYLNNKINWQKQCKLTFDLTYEGPVDYLQIYYNMCSRLPRKHDAVSFHNNIFILKNGNLYIYLQSPQTAPRLLDTIPNVCKLASQTNNNVTYLTYDGKLYMYHYNQLNEIKKCIIDGKLAPLPPDIIDISCGELHTVVLRANGKLMSYGYNGYGQLGLGDYNDRSILTEIPNLPTNIAQLKCGQINTIIKLSNEKMMKCGYDYYGSISFNKFTDMHTSYKSKITQYECLHNSIIIKRHNTLEAYGLDILENINTANVHKIRANHGYIILFKKNGRYQVINCYGKNVAITNKTRLKSNNTICLSDKIIEVTDTIRIIAYI